MNLKGVLFFGFWVVVLNFFAVPFKSQDFSQRGLPVRPGDVMKNEGTELIITSFGAHPESLEDASPAVSEALEELRKKWGGILVFPNKKLQ